MSTTILEAREMRWQRRQELAEKYCETVLTLGLNIPGPDKNLPGAKEAAEILRVELLHGLAEALVYEEWDFGPDGPHWHGVFRLPALEVKAWSLRVESEHSLGRLADADVLAANGKAVSRRDLGNAPRACFVCNEDAALCRRMQRHPAEELSACVRATLSALTP